MVRRNEGKWTWEEHDAFLRGLNLHGKNWEAVAKLVPTRSEVQVRSHSQKYFSKILKGEKFPNTVSEAANMFSTKGLRRIVSFVCKCFRVPAFFGVS